MISAVTHATQTEPTGAVAAQSQPVAKSVTSSQKSTPSQPQSKTSIPTDTVQISNAAKAALQETIETPAETAKEASGGDRQAQRLLAKEAAEKAG